MKKITGEFEVQLAPLDGYMQGKDDIQFARMSINKTFTGELKATSQGEMLSARTPVNGSAGYVAMEQVKGELSGKSGSFVLQHFGVMDQGKDRLILEVVPDSGTGELKGLIGIMSITIKDGQHFYAFEFEIEE